MAKYIIEGGNKLKGRVTLSGNKNSILPCLAASLLTDEEVTLHNVPKIADVEVFLKILRELGAEVEEGDHLVKVKCAKINKTTLPDEWVNKLRAAILFVGPLLARFGKAEFPFPGGDIIGRRSIEAHLLGFQDLGFEFQSKDRYYRSSSLHNKKKVDCIFLSEASVTATENLLLASSLIPDETIIKNCACEPHVVDICNMLIEMGVQIEGVGTQTLKIKGTQKLKGVEFTISADYMEFGTYAVAAALTGGEIEIEKKGFPDLDPIIYPLSRMGVIFQDTGNTIKVSAETILPISSLKTNLWPGFPTDVMSLVIVLATQAKGVSLLHDWMYESRMFFVDKLISMGAQITIADPHRVLVYGPTKLYGRSLESPDIRAGMALVLAALIAEGKSEINRIEHIERGYEDIVGKLSSLGAKIERVE
ncbi:MAG: UDP-N-acetylglucosamine 1-carboxyvinyltransferase [Candidatus Daviesbacteria bacterium]